MMNDFVVGKDPIREIPSERRKIFLGTYYTSVHDWGRPQKEAEPLDIYVVLTPYNTTKYGVRVYVCSPRAAFSVPLNNTNQPTDYTCQAHFDAVGIGVTYFKNNWWQLLTAQKGSEWDFLNTR